MKLSEIKSALRSGPYAWPGGYPRYFICSDGEAMSFAAVRENWREIVAAHLANDRRSGWYLEGLDINWEDPELYCAHSGARIESAYAEDTPRPMRGDEARAILRDLGWTQRDAARRLGITLRHLEKCLAPTGALRAPLAELLRKYAVDGARSR